MTLSQFKSAYLSIEENGPVVVARFLRPQLSEEENIEQMGQELVSLVEQYQCRLMVLSLELVDFITSAALGKIIMLHRRLHRKDGKLVVCAAHGTVAEVLESSRLNEYFVMAPDTKGALALFATN
jgi:anti-sigma B factor antagonist